MADSWKLTAFGSKPVVQAALLAQEDVEDWPWDVTLTGFELADDRPDDWRLDAYFNRKPNAADRRMIAALFAGGAPRLVAEKLPATDWLTESQRGLEPIVAGPFHVRTPDHPRKPGAVDFAIPASQAFGTGHHATTAGCLAMLAAMKARGLVVRNLADIGTGTGLLAFAALALWPRALATASDIDPVCAGVVEENARLNGVPMNAGAGQVTMVVADGMDDPLLQARGPYDLLIANILAGPLVELAADFGSTVAPGGSLLLAGLLEMQERAVRRACTRAGFRLAARMVNGDWSILWLRKRGVQSSLHRASASR
jgi:ribosomal protein L11 methyltransferase